MRYAGDISNPLSINQYIYCSNNPLIHIDPSGHVEIGLRYEVERIGGEVLGWDSTTSAATVKIGDTVSTYTAGIDGRINDKGRMIIDSYALYRAWI